MGNHRSIVCFSNRSRGFRARAQETEIKQYAYKPISARVRTLYLRHIRVVYHIVSTLCTRASFRYVNACGRNMEEASDSFTRFLRPSKRTVLLILVVVVITIVISAAVSILLQRTTNLSVPSFGTIKTLGVEAYWDIDCENKTEEVKWGEILIGSSENVTFYVRSISNVEATLYLNATNWEPSNLSDYMNLSWNYNGTTVHPGEIIQVTLTLSAPYSSDFILYLITNNVKEFNLDICIHTSEYTS